MNGLPLSREQVSKCRPHAPAPTTAHAVTGDPRQETRLEQTDRAFRRGIVGVAPLPGRRCRLYHHQPTSACGRPRRLRLAQSSLLPPSQAIKCRAVRPHDEHRYK